MRIKMEKRKSGIYAQWYVVEGINLSGRRCSYLIYSNQANTYAKAVQFFKKAWGDKGHIGLELRNAEPFDNNLCLAC